MGLVTASAIHRGALATAAVAGAFVLSIASVLLYQHATATTNDPWKSPQLLELKERLQSAPKDEAVKARIRVLDLRFRQEYRRRLQLAASGGWLLLAGSAVLVLALQAAAEAKKRLPQPRPDHEAAVRALRLAAWARRSVAVAGGLGLASMLVVAFGVRSSLDGQAGAVPAGAAATTPAAGLPLPAEFARNWPRFRGPDGGGVAVGTDAPLNWDAASGAGVSWKTAVPTPGFNSPIVWGDRVFVSGATKENREVFCFDAGSGQLVWRCRIELTKAPGAKAPDLPDTTGYAAPTMATDGRRVYAIFAHGDLAAVTFDGKVAWTKHLGVPKNPYGHATSLAVWRDRVIVQYDQGESGPANSKLLAFDGATGRIVWEKARPVSSSWATPIVIEAAGKTQIVTLGVPFVIAYAFADGAELWRAEILDGEVTPSPIYAGGLVMVVNPSNILAAIKPDGAGDVTATHLVWKADDNMPDVTSPVSDGELVYTVNSGGMVTCFEIKAGQKVWEHDLETEVQASPVIVGRRLYVACANGDTVVIENGRAYRELARNKLGEKVFASPAVVGGRLYLRGLQHLFCLAGAEGKP